MKKEEFERQFKEIIKKSFVIVKGKDFTFNANDYHIELNYVYFLFGGVLVGYTKFKSIRRLY